MNAAVIHVKMAACVKIVSMVLHVSVLRDSKVTYVKQVRNNHFIIMEYFLTSLLYNVQYNYIYAKLI